MKSTKFLNVMAIALTVVPLFSAKADDQRMSVLERAGIYGQIPVVGLTYTVKEAPKGAKGGWDFLPSNGISASAGGNAQIVEQIMEHSDDATRGNIVLMGAIDLGPLAAELNLSTE